MPGCLLRSVALVLLSILPSAAVHHQPVAAPQSAAQSSADSNPNKVIHVIVAGATGDLAAKYLWVSMFRLALESKLTRHRTIRFLAGAADSLEQGKAWLKAFFDDEFDERVCGVFDKPKTVAQIKCREFLNMEFKQSVHYAPLLTKDHYQELGRSLVKINEFHFKDMEEGRIVYLAIPPQFFLPSCELIHRYLRPQRLDTEAAPFLRVVVEKPFGRDFQSTQDLATRLRTIFSTDELYVMDHYAGKPVVHALRNYFQLNAAVLHQVWNSEFIDDIYIEMLETATVESRVHYFDSVGIIRDIMVNHLQLLLNVAVLPSFSINTKPIPIRNAARLHHESQLHFIKALVPSSLQESLFVAQYTEYAAHFEAETSSLLNESDHFTPTATSIELRSSLDKWLNTTFRLAAAKAASERLLSITITFKAETFSNDQDHQCALTITIQRAHTADPCQSHRIEWSCDVFPDLQLPKGWKFLEIDNDRIITPTQVSEIPKEEIPEWELGDDISAYDVLLREIARGAIEQFADLDEIEAAWAVWTPVVQAVESIRQKSVDAGGASRLGYDLYPIGTTPWKRSHINFAMRSQGAKEEL